VISLASQNHTYLSSFVPFALFHMISG